jgi:transcription-repair coupling factor (superfamily II helicase)
MRSDQTMAKSKANIRSDPGTWLDQMSDSRPIDQLITRLNKSGTAAVYGALGSAGNLLAGMIAKRTQRPVLHVVAHLDDADDALADLNLFNHMLSATGKETGVSVEARRFAALEVLPGETGVSLELLAERLAIVGSLIQKPDSKTLNNIPILVAPITALMQLVPKPESLGQYHLTLRADQNMPPGQLLEWLDRAGYQRTDAIEEPGDFAVRGGTIDIYAPSSVLGDQNAGSTSAQAHAVRLDYFGDEIESITMINQDTMGSGAKIGQIQLIGASLEVLQSDEQTTSLLQLLHKDTITILSEPMELAEQARGYYERLSDSRGIQSPQDVLKILMAGTHIDVTQYASGAHDAIALPTEPLVSFDRDIQKAMGELALQAESQTVYVLCQKPAERDRLADLLAEHTPQALAGNLNLEMGYLHRGFVWAPETEATIVLIPHHELFHRYHLPRRVRRISTSGVGQKAADAFVDLEAGDHVVHADHGIARFVGLRNMRRSGRTEEYLTLQFAGSAMLHVPATQIDLVQKYIGGFRGQPPLSKLGGKRWSRQKERVVEAVKDLAAQMLQIQAARANLPGVRFPLDTAWQKEFEAEFPYDETEDQLAAMSQIKKDMAHDKPMDRLICGDVGFGKTELAIRAAFKAVEFGKQVAVLVPTTVLAEQHGRTFGERTADYPFRVESLSRFKTTAQQSKMLKDLAAGQVDIIIGTHRLLSKDVRFSDLGLVIVDEEQRFGVEHKQKLLEYRLTADVLTLSATPIPRTLHMSMLGLRDISSLTTAPLDRRAIVTEVIPYDEQLIRRAIVREMNRGGQIFFVHNRVHNIQSMADDIAKLAPDARMLIGHGQMPGNELEEVMRKFINREADILVCTTIIESGIDIPTANTIFINQADRFGLADLHQLRGRVGRYKHRAYCYLLLPAERQVTPAAIKRLKAIEQYSMLGAGFKIAMRDLEIRGAGNLLGPEQSGHIAAVGYQMYCQLLEREAAKLRHEKQIEPLRTHLELPASGRLMKSYISGEKHRMECYRRLTRAVTIEESQAVVKDITDAYGPVPAQVQTLFDLTEIRIAATLLDISMIKLEGPDIIFTTTRPRKLDQVFAKARGRLTHIDKQTVYFRPPKQYLEPSTMLNFLRHRLSGKSSAP